MLNNTSWKQATFLALREIGGSGSPKAIGQQVMKMKPGKYDEKAFSHAIRSALDSLKKEGRVVRVKYGMWSLK